MSDDFEPDGPLPLPSIEDLKRLKGEDPEPPRRRSERIWVGPSAPASKAADRQYVPATLKHWRNIHGLTQKQATARIGLSLRSNAWSLWESGQRAPTYENLLKIIAASGLGHWVDAARDLDVDPTLRLDVLKAREQQRKDK
jgi:hypothetical protein